MVGTCPYLLFAYFLDKSPPWELHCAYSADGTHWKDLNGGYPVLNTTVPNTSIRDPFMNKAPDGNYYLVSTDGQNFGGNPNILSWTSSDLIHWSEQRVIPVMQPSQFGPNATVADTWAPEWVWDDSTSSFMVFWAARGQNLLPTLPSSNCTGTSNYRFAFFASWTTDWSTFTEPQLLFDPECYVEGSGDGAIDGDIVRDENGRFLFVYKDARGESGEINRGIRLASAETLTGPYTNATISPDWLVPTLVEAPQIVQSPDGGPGGFFLYFDCSFWPIPPGQPRPPYGVAHIDSLVNAGFPGNEFSTIPGACTGNSTQTAFPSGATHGSFICIDEQQLQALQAAFPGSG